MGDARVGLARQLRWAMMGGCDRGWQEWLALGGRGKRRLGFCLEGGVDVAVARIMTREEERWRLRCKGSDQEG